MDTVRPLRLLPTLPMIADAFSQAGWDFSASIPDITQSYRGIRLYHGQQLHPDILYLLLPQETRFSFDSHTYLSVRDLGGRGNHLIFSGRSDAQIMDFVLELFSQFQTWEDALDLLLYREADLQELCEQGARILENPVCIHDDWFVMTAGTREFDQIMAPEYSQSSAMGYVPRAIMEDFQNDNEYLETYTHRSAQIWTEPQKGYESLYVNLWDGSIYKGRLLVGRQNRAFRPRDFLLAEAIAQRAVLLMRRKQPGGQSPYQNMDDLVYSLLQGQQPESIVLNRLLNMLHWQNTDSFLCLRVKGQQSMDVVMDHMLHSDLFQIFPGSYVLLDGQTQCVILNTTQTQDSLSQIRHRLAPICRDYCLYAGISSPVRGIRELHAAYYQSGAALDQAFRLRSDRWIIAFSECVLEHLLRTLPPPLTSVHLTAPELITLKEYDRIHGTQYFETFREYLLQERDIPKTAQALIIHRTTLIYRLKKIQSLIPVNLEDPWQRMYLILSLWLLKKDRNTPNSLP